MAPSTQDPPVAVGQVLAGKYRVDQVIGKGGMGVVVSATNLDLSQRVALKFLLPARAADPEVRTRFLREARAAANLRTQHVTRVFDVGTLASGAPYMVMELLQGSDLDHLLAQRGPRPIPEAVEYILQACEAVGEAHQAGIVHRDLKPANLFLTQHADGSPHVKVLDFGVAHVVGVLDMRLTGTAQMIGSPLYMSPEQMQGKAGVDVRTDIWALGVTLYELVTGRGPFRADSPLALQAHVLALPPIPLAEHLPEAPAGFEAVLFRCLAKEREQRWPDVGAFAAALEPFAPPHAKPYVARVAGVLGVTGAISGPARSVPVGLAATSPANVALTAAMVGTTTGGSASDAQAARPRRRAASIAVAGVALTGLALGGVGLAQWRLGPFSSTAPAGAASSASPPTSAAAEAPTASAAAPAAAEPAPPITPGDAASSAPPAAASASAGPTAAGHARAPPPPRPRAAPAAVIAAPPGPPPPAPPGPDIFSRGTRTR